MTVGSPPLTPGEDSLSLDTLIVSGVILGIVVLFLWDVNREKVERSAWQRGRESGRAQAHQEQTEAEYERLRKDPGFRKALLSATGIDANDNVAWARWKHEHAAKWDRIEELLKQYHQAQDEDEPPPD